MAEQIDLPLGDEAAKTGMLQVFKNVPVPKTLRTTTSTRRKYPFETMEVGDMFFIPERTKNTLATHASTVGRKLNRKFLTKLAYMRMTKEGWKPCDSGAAGAVLGIGVWRKA